MVQVLADIGRYPPVVQPEDGITYAAKIDKAESRIDFSAGAVQAERQIRAFNPAPGAWFEYQGERFKILAATVDPGQGDPGITLDDALLIGCGTDGALRPTLIQRAGKGAMSPAELLRGFPIPAGTRFHV
jgi:methionyl-tRNA formyltransferase